MAIVVCVSLKQKLEESRGESYLIKESINVIYTFPLNECNFMGAILLPFGRIIAYLMHFNHGILSGCLSDGCVVSGGPRRTVGYLSCLTPLTEEFVYRSHHVIAISGRATSFISILILCHLIMG